MEYKIVSWFNFLCLPSFHKNCMSTFNFKFSLKEKTLVNREPGSELACQFLGLMGELKAKATAEVRANNASEHSTAAQTSLRCINISSRCLLKIFTTWRIYTISHLGNWPINMISNSRKLFVSLVNWLVLLNTSKTCTKLEDKYKLFQDSSLSSNFRNLVIFS